MRTKQVPGLATVLFGNSMRAILAQLYGRPPAPGSSSGTRTGARCTTRPTPTVPSSARLKGIVTKTFGVADLVRDVLRPHEKHIRAAFIYGSVAKGTEAPGSDVDLLVIGDLPPSDLAIDLDKIMLDLRRRVSLTSYSVDEFVRMRAEENSFVTRVLAGPVIWLMGNRETMDALGPLQPRKPRARKAAAR
jgi:predicted nucleotidyltransferase